MDMTAYAFSTQPGFVEDETRELFRKAVALRTIVIYCYDPRAVNIPNAVARTIPGEVYPGNILRDASGRKVASTTTVFPVVVAGGRAVDALRSITVAQHLFGIENIAVVHHTYCGATSFTPRDSSTRSARSRVSISPPCTMRTVLRFAITSRRWNMTYG